MTSIAIFYKVSLVFTLISLLDDVSEFEKYPSDLVPAFHVSQLPIPEDLVDFISSYAYSNKESNSFENILCSKQDFLGLDSPSFSSSITPEDKVPSPFPSPEQTYKKPSRVHRVADKDRQSKKRKLNRDAAFRYRQKVKAKNEKLQGDLLQAIRAFSDARKKYESARDAFDALKKVVLDMGVASVVPCV